MRATYTCFGFFVVFFLLANCGNEEKNSGEVIARRYCGSCHQFPQPAVLDKITWEKKVLPKMGAMLGIDSYNDQYLTTIDQTDIGKKNGSIDFNDWGKIVQYYISQAPHKLPLQKRSSIKAHTNRFAVKESSIKTSNPATSFARIDPGNQLIYVGAMSDSSVLVFDKNLELIMKHKVKNLPVHLTFEDDMAMPGDRIGVLTSIGTFYPNNQETGRVESFNFNKEGKIIQLSLVADSLPRPVQTTILDIDKDGLNDYLVCGFGNESGSFFYLHKKTTQRFEKKLIRSQPGAINSFVEDLNDDKLPDLITLFAQGDEGIYLFTNKGNGDFETTRILIFPPVYGSTYFEMQDVNGDGLKDIIYTCGDNFDYSRILKNYHGVYIFVNKGGHHFEQEYFFPINGCYKAIARDFDKDGDVDLATISYFPDVKTQPEESFVYLENSGKLHFTPFTIQQYHRGRWITMDAADIDSDGDDDIVIGSLIPKDNNQPATTNQEPDKPSFLFLENLTR